MVVPRGSLVFLVFLTSFIVSEELLELVVHCLEDVERLDLVTGEFHYLYGGAIGGPGIVHKIPLHTLRKSGRLGEIKISIGVVGI